MRSAVCGDRLSWGVVPSTINPYGPSGVSLGLIFEMKTSSTVRFREEPLMSCRAMPFALPCHARLCRMLHVPMSWIDREIHQTSGQVVQASEAVQYDRFLIGCWIRTQRKTLMCMCVHGSSSKTL